MLMTLWLHYRGQAGHNDEDMVVTMQNAFQPQCVGHNAEDTVAPMQRTRVPQ